jgi:peptide/nickel transport system permease protein
VTTQTLAPRRSFWQRYRKNRLAVFGLVALVIMYVVALFPEFTAPGDPELRDRNRVLAPPQRVRFFDAGTFRGPFVYDLKFERDPTSGVRTYVEDTTTLLPVRLFVQGEPYKMLGFIPWDRRLVGVTHGLWYPLGGDAEGRNVLSRIIFAGRISLTIGIIGAVLTIFLGTVLGTVSGFFGGWIDTAIQRTIELLAAFPTIPLWMSLAAAMPATWSPVTEFFLISLLLSLLGWGGLARQIRGIVLSLRESDYVVAASAIGSSRARIIFQHLIPNILGYVVINLTLAIPFVILGETALSFLGLGLRPPVNSWGVLLTEAQNIRVIVSSPWLMLPGLFVVLAVLSYNFVGDGTRDALDPHKQ